MLFKHRKCTKLLAGNHSNRTGFALVIALSLMAFVLVLLLSLTTLVQVETSSANNEIKKLQAEQAAVLSLNIAIGKLQETLGSDQRVTATAEILNDGANLYNGKTTPLKGQGSWTGVWKSDTVSNGTPSYSSVDPNTREFVGWLVSNANATGQLELPTALDAIENSPVNSVTLATNSTGNAYASVGKVEIESNSLNQIAYAFMVEDESVKADLSWSEHPQSATSADRHQTRRLAAASGPDYGALNGASATTGPFDSLTYPLSSESSPLIADRISKLSNVAGITSTMSSGSDADTWLKDSRGDVTWGSRGVMADVKWGGLRRDLSLAFEMDGDADMSVSEQPTKFNQQVGEFVGGSDRYASPTTTPGMGGRVARHLYRDYDGSGSLFEGSFATSDGVIRGPTWWAMRDYANLYKRLSRSGDEFALEARAYYPNRSCGTTEMTDLFPPGAAGGVWDWEYNSGSANYIYRPARANYSPVYLGMTCLIGIKVIAGEVALSLDPIFHFWNPYNVDLNFESIAITMDKYAFPGNISIWTKDASATVETKTDFKLLEIVNNSSNINTETSFFLHDPGASSITMKAGEVMVFSSTPVTSVTPQKIRGSAEPGYFESGFDDTGIIVTNLPGVPAVTADSEVGFVYRKGERGGSNRTKLQTSLPSSGATEASVYSNPGEDMQGYILNLAPFKVGYQEYVNSLADVGENDARSVTSTGASSNANVPVSALGIKRFFGLFSLLSKPAHFAAAPADGSVMQSNPVEVFSRFNPLYLTTNEDLWHSVPPNMLYNIVTSDQPNDLINNYGMSLSTSPRNAFWGAGFDSTGSTSVPMLDIPTSPLLSLAAFANSNLSVMATEPMRAVGNSWSSPFFEPTAPYGRIRWHPTRDINLATGGDTSWLMNDALFDRYYLSGLAPDYTIGSSGYTTSGSMDATLTAFYSNDYTSANASPVLRPYIPSNKTAAEVISELKADDGYLKVGAYSLIDGQFNVNSTSTTAWAAFLRSNRELEIIYAQGSVSDSPSSDSPFPNSSRPSNPTAPSGLESKPQWAGLSRLSDAQIDDLAEKIVDQVKLRGPFMSLSDFVNHRVGPLEASTSYAGAIQAALDIAATSSSINGGSRSALGSITPDYTSGFYDGTPPMLGQSTAGIPTDITQANVLLPLAPRLSARSDTFRIRAYGEVSTMVGSDDTLSAICEAVVQRLPEYVDSVANEPWDEAFNPLSPSASQLSALNERFGRKYKIVSFRWLSGNEI